MDQQSFDDIVENGVDTNDAVKHSEQAPDTPVMTAPTIDNSGDIHVPEVGMTFSSHSEATSFYEEYACRTGFATIIRNSKKGEDGKPRYLVLACSREGKHVSTAKIKMNCPTTKMECPAKIRLLLRKDGLWYITGVILDHVHHVSPQKSRLFPGNRSISLSVKRTIQMNDEAGIRLNKTYRSLVQDAGGFDNVTFVERDVRNFVMKERRMIGKHGDGKALMAYFARMQQQNSNFFYEIDVDNEFHLRSVFWADARTRAACESFGDVVSFDTTYLTNKYDMPFAPFVGVNHHGQSILLGCGLLSTEDTGSFVWLFESWLRCMSGNAPIGIVTDQCKAMQAAIKVVFPNIRHRWCLWHIMKKLPEKFGAYEDYTEITNDIKVAVYDSLSESEFEGTWARILAKYGLQQNEWLTGLFEERSKWVPVYLKKYFWAGMSTTQRSESVNAFFDGYINSKTCLAQFARQYDNALQDKAEKEYKEDFRSFNSTLPCISTSLVERQFQKEYTHAKFSQVQAEFKGKMNCCIVKHGVEGSITVYDVREDLMVNDRPREVMYKVSMDPKNADVDCSCLLFQFRGIICRHTLLVLHQQKIVTVPQKYILSRWSKVIRRRHSYIKGSYDVKELRPKMQRYEKLRKALDEIAEEAAESEQQTQLLADAIKVQRAKIKAFKPSNEKETSPMTCATVQSQDHDPQMQVDETLTQIQSPRRVKRRGRPLEKRKMSNVEKIIKKRKKTSTNVAHTITMNETTNATINENSGNTISMESSLKISSTNESARVPIVSTAGPVNDVEFFQHHSCVTELSQPRGHSFSELLASVHAEMPTKAKELTSEGTYDFSNLGTSYNHLQSMELGPY